MQFFGRHGAHAFETETGQVFIVDLELSVDLAAAGETDDLNQTVHYGHVFEAVQEVVEGPPFQLIEAVATAVANRILDRFPPVAAVTVRVHKPRAPIPGVFADVCVEIARQRG